MCLAVPLQLLSIDGNDAIAGRDGISRKIRVDFIHAPKVGDYVIVHAGFAIERLTPEQADADQAAAAELAAAMQEIYEEDRQRAARRMAEEVR